MPDSRPYEFCKIFYSKPRLFDIDQRYLNYGSSLRWSLPHMSYLALNLFESFFRWELVSHEYIYIFFIYFFNKSCMRVDVNCQRKIN